MLADDDRAHLLRLAVVRLVVPGGERVRAKKDPPLRLVAEALVPRALVHLRDVVVADVRAVAVPHTVVAREVRRRLGGSDQVVARQAVFDRTRKRALLDLRAELAAVVDRAPYRVGHAWLDALRLVQLLRHADANAVQILGVRQLDRRNVHGRRVARVAAGDDLVEEGRVANGLRGRPDLVERRRKRDDAVTRDGPVGRAQADDSAERGWLLDRTAGVRPERPRREARGDGRGRAAARPAGHARRIPRVQRGAVRGVLGGRAHRELVGVGLAEERQPRVFDA